MGYPKASPSLSAVANFLVKVNCVVFYLEKR